MTDVIVAAVNAFPAMSGTATRVLRLLGDDDANVSEVEDAVRIDPGLTANILRVANSAYFGAPQTVGSVHQAVVMLGWKRMMHIIVASTVNGVLEQPVQGYGLPPGELWRHSLAVTVAAEVLAEEHEVTEPDQLFTADWKN